MLTFTHITTHKKISKIKVNISKLNIYIQGRAQGLSHRKIKSIINIYKETISMNKNDTLFISYCPAIHSKNEKGIYILCTEGEAKRVLSYTETNIMLTHSTLRETYPYPSYDGAITMAIIFPFNYKDINNYMINDKSLFIKD